MQDKHVPHLAITDADGIHEYVFSPHELRLVRGGSRLQKELNIEAGRVAERFKGETIFTGGGTVLAKLLTEQAAEQFCESVKELYRKRTAIGTVSSATIAYRDNSSFEEVHRSLRDRLELNKQARSRGGFNAGSPFWVSCEACGQHPASGVSPIDRKRICQACRLREERGYKEPGAAEDFEEIGREAKPENYVAIAYVDLDRLGEYLYRFAKGESEYRTLSTKIRDIVAHSVQRGFHGIGKRELLLLGGDDAIVALPAEHAIGFLRRFARTFRSADFTPASERPTFSVGLVMAHSHYPIAEFIRIAEELQRSAKTIRGADAIDYEIITSPMTDQVVKQRETAQGRARTGKPYVLEDFFGLTSGVHGLKKANAPASQVKALYRIAHSGVMQGELEYLDTLSRVDIAVRRRLLEIVGSRLWKEKDGEAWTAAADLVELWEFVDASEIEH